MHTSADATFRRFDNKVCLKILAECVDKLMGFGS